MQTAIDKIVEFLSTRGWKCNVEQDRPLVQTSANGKNGRWPCIAMAGNENEHLIFLSIFPVNVPAAKRSAVAELITRINYRLTHGCYEFDFDDGEIRFRTSIPVFSGGVAVETLEYLVFANLCTFDNHFEAIMRVLYTGTSPKNAMEKPKSKKVRKPRFELN